CSEFARNAGLAIEDIVRFDEAENGVAKDRCAFILNCQESPGLGAASRTSVADVNRYPQFLTADTSGWMMLNLDQPGEASQAWVTASMSAGSLSVDIEAAALGNGCAPAAPPSDFSTGAIPIAPSNTRDDSCDIALLPAATLLLPHFRVDQNAKTVTTLLSVTNTTREDRIARVTLWTDLAVPILTFNVFLTGYDMQSIDLYDVIVRGVIGSGTSSEGRRGPHSARNRDIELGGCEALPGPLPPELAQRAVLAFTEGITEDCGEVGLVHTFATGYATIDVVRNCASVDPEEPSYWTRDVAFDNVLTGDYQVVDLAMGAAEGAPLVHIRAVSEGARNEHTFYSRLSNGRDARQPLPSTFAARWNKSGGATLFEIWREAAAGITCGRFDRSWRRFADLVRFDDDENAVAERPQARFEPIDVVPTLPSTSRTHIDDASVYPQLFNGATSGWMYFNLNDPADAHATQAWVAATQLSISRGLTRRDAVALGNGCSPPVASSEPAKGTAVIGPAPKRNR
ncbi:MAG TPA: hypothetical protein VM733_22580, partial [Thermoanaerobaculia bacterium]|nr:hypothetical protein [Thermoanaerobaculia bacterium]